MENEEAREDPIEPFVGIVQHDRYGTVPDAEQERLADAMLLNLRVAEHLHGRRQEYLHAEVKIGVNVRDQRIREGISQEQLAHTMGLLGFEMHQTTVAKIEAGKRPLRIAEMLALADALSVPWMSLMEGGRDIDVFPSEGMMPLDVWEEGLEGLLFHREDVIGDILQHVETKAREYAEWDRMILLRISALANAAASARRAGEDVDEERVNALLQKWTAQAGGWTARTEPSDETTEEIRALNERRQKENEQQRVLLKEFLVWRAKSHPEAKRGEHPEAS